MRRKLALCVIVVLVAAPSAEAKLDARGGVEIARGTTPTGLEFRVRVLKFGIQRPQRGRATCISLQRRYEIPYGKDGWVGEDHCDTRPLSDRRWSLQAFFGGSCDTGDGSAIGFARPPRGGLAGAPVSARVLLWDGQVVPGSMAALPARFHRDYAAFYTPYAARTAPRRVQVHDISGALVAQVRFARREALWVEAACRDDRANFYLGSPRVR